MRVSGRVNPITIDSFEKKWGVKFTTEHTGKMEGFASLSTAPSCNTYCSRRSKCAGTICSHCYSIRMGRMYGNLDAMLSNNFKVLTTKLIPVEEMPILNYLAFRFESFGDVQNETQLKNYFNICKRNPRVTFSIWTKNPAIFKRTIDKGNAKPSNLIIIVSSPFINRKLDVNRYDFADKVFTVYDKDTAKAKGIEINCGANCCLNCMKCYTKNNIREVNEFLK